MQIRSSNDMQDEIYRLGSIRGANTPSDSLRSLQEHPKMAQRQPPGPSRRTQGAPGTAPRRFQDGPWYLQNGPNCAQLLQRAPRSPPGLDLGPSRLRFWTLRTSFFNPPDIDFAPFGYRSWRGGGNAALLRIGYYYNFSLL